jgi:hypothetical protein
MKKNKYYDIMEEPKVDIKEKDFLKEAEKEKKELEETYRESRRQTEERKLKEKTESEKSQDDLEPIVNAPMMDKE